MLALSLSVVVVAAITAAIAVYMVNLNRQQRFIEQKQIARSVLAMISNDLRAGLQYKAVDVSGIENLSASQSLISGLLGSGAAEGLDTEGLLDSAGMGESAGDMGAGADTGGGAGGGMGSSGAGGTSGGAADETGTGEETEEEDAASFRPTLIGSATSINIDISRLPRLDQYHSLLTGGDLSSQTGSDVKSICYQISSEGPTNQADGFEPNIAKLGGLYRRQIDRAVASFRGEFIAPAGPDEYSQLVAPEIIEIQFRYFDGQEWATSWDSEETGSFPLAVEVVIVLDPNRTTNVDDQANRVLSAQDILDMQTYRSVVHLPAAEAPPEEEE
jgi:hypothetical protein